MKKYISFSLTILLCLSVYGCENALQTQAPAPNIPAEAPAPVEQRVSFYGVGDNLIHDSVYWRASEYAGGNGYDFTPMYEFVADDIAVADIAYINQETLLGGTELGLSSYPLFNSPHECGRDMIALGFDVFSLATNHVFDKGEAGLASAYAFFAENPSVTAVGIHKKDEDIIKIVEKNGIKIAFLNYTYLTNGFAHPANSAYQVPLADYKNGCVQMAAKIQEAKTRADFVVCCVHWGEEYQNAPNAIQRESAQILADAGCDVIIGTHPHTVQPAEYIGDTLVVYSLGNFISAQKAAVSQVGGTIAFDFVTCGDEKRIENVTFQAVINHYNPAFRNMRIIPFDEYTPEKAQTHGAGISYSYLENLIQNVMTIEGEYK